MSLSPFDITKLLFTKDRKLTDEELEKDYSQWMINKILSCDQRLAIIVNELNKSLTNRMHYDFLYHVLPKSSNKYIPYLCKKPKEEKEINHISEYYSVNQSTAKLYHSLLSEEELKKINDFFDKRGLCK